MTRPKSRRRRRLYVFLLVPPVLWALVLVLAPTEWARSRVESALAAAVGRPVRIAALRLGAFGGVRLEGVEIAGPGAEQDPWLKAGAVQININLVQLLQGHLDPTRFEVDDASLRLYRRADGTLELADLLGGPTAPAPAAPAPPTEAGWQGPKGLNFRLRGGRISVVDDVSATRLEFEGVEGQGTWRRGRVDLKALKGQLNGGSFEMAARLDRGGDGPAFEGQARIQGAQLDVGMGALTYLVPVLGKVPASLDGRLDLNLYLRGRGATGEAVAGTLEGQGNVALGPVQLDGTRVVAELADLVRLPERGRVGSIASSFTIGNRQVLSPDLTLTVADIPIVLSGWADFGGRVDYQVRSDALAGRISPQAREILADLPIDLDKVMTIRLRGTADALVVSVDDVPLNVRALHDPDQRASLRRRLREAGRQELERRLRDRLRR